jgi:hypothetical protein
VRYILWAAPVAGVVIFAMIILVSGCISKHDHDDLDLDD